MGLVFASYAGGKIEKKKWPIFILKYLKFS